MALQLYNTMSREVEPFHPLQAPQVSLYACGPTVYNYAHIGNFRTFLFEDVLRRWLEVSGYQVFHIMNLTDVDDKTIRGAHAAGVTLSQHVAPFIEAFHADRKYLRILDAQKYPRATEFIPQQIALVEDLLRKGVAYSGDDGSIYFAIARFPAYGRLSRLDTRELRMGAGGRVSADEYSKEDARDFVLWKRARPEDEAVEAAWDAPFGRGRPGWHLECSTMALALIRESLGTRVLDIHAGGIDLIFPHHEDEIAQSCAHTGETQFARYWLHGEFLTMAGTKMSKRFGNILTARDLQEEGVDPGTVRLLFATTHYRQALDFNDAALASAREGSRRLGDFGARLDAASPGESSRMQDLFDQLAANFSLAMDADLNTPRALAALFETAREGNRLLDQGSRVSSEQKAAWRRWTGVLQVLPEPALVEHVGLSQDNMELSDQPPPDESAAHQWARAWAGRRVNARKEKDFTEADRIRKLLLEQGWEVRDHRDGTLSVQRHQP